MSIKVGLVGLPNVGKSTLFNALTKSQVPAENYAFCTIDPHVATTNVPDHRLAQLLQVYQSTKIIPTQINFVDIAGLVKGAAAGAGLGNQFLAHIREVDLILYILRCFDDPAILRDTPVDPLSDYEIIATELVLKDLESIAKRLEKLPKLIRTVGNSPKEKLLLEQELTFLTQLSQLCDQGDLNAITKFVAAHPQLATIPLLCTKNFLVIANLPETDVESARWPQNRYYQTLVARFGASRVIPVCAKLEYELSQLEDPAEIAELSSMMGLDSSGLDRIIAAAYHNLGLITFFTCGPKEIHAWSLPAGRTIRQAAGEIHSDLERGFICADIFNCADLLATGNLNQLKETGKIRTEGQTYLVQDGDIVNVKFNV
ncbi:MAG TPA: redox-regulated ATPase YchF [Candidatus Babeliales bacterium]|nr:redox-regulated ATPase YchF [Candidatus Babeliales bacterium]